MSITPPPAGWFQAPHGEEKVWVGLAILWCVVMTIAMPLWFFLGKQNSAGESYKVTPDAFRERVDRFVAAHQVGELQGVPVVEPAPGGDSYLQAQMWSWYPILKLRRGQTYRVHISSLDLQHGFSLLPLNVNLQVVPGYDYALRVAPTEAGDFRVVCNEFCGIGHHLMSWSEAAAQFSAPEEADEVRATLQTVCSNVVVHPTIGIPLSATMDAIRSSHSPAVASSKRSLRTFIC